MTDVYKRQGNNNAAEIYGWEFAVGDTIILHYYDGNKMSEKKVTILGILNHKYVLDHNGLQGWFLMPEQAILNFLSYDSLNAHLLVSTEACLLYTSKSKKVHFFRCEQSRKA